LSVYIDDQSLNPDYRYRCILSLEYKLENATDLICCLCLQFARNIQNSDRFRILACQNLLANDTQDRDEIETLLLQFARDKQCLYQSDAADVLLYLGSRESIQEAQAVIEHLSVGSLFYHNEQNVHLKSIEKGIINIIQYLDTLDLHPLPHFDFICTRLDESLEKEPEDLARVRDALTRIELDRTLFKEINHSLQTIFLMLWSYIGRHEYRDELKKRMIEELVDMSDTCTTGYLGRLVNVLSGFGECSLHISWEEQIAANLRGRLNARLRLMEDEDLKDKILGDMTMNDALFKKPAFNQFFREHISEIKEEMYKEFREHIPDTDWDLYFRKAIMDYEGYNC
jgi:hypothetical protein